MTNKVKVLSVNWSRDNEAPYILFEVSGEIEVNGEVKSFKTQAGGARNRIMYAGECELMIDDEVKDWEDSDYDDIVSAIEEAAGSLPQYLEKEAEDEILDLAADALCIDRNRLLYCQTATAHEIREYLEDQDCTRTLSSHQCFNSSHQALDQSYDR